MSRAAGALGVTEWHAAQLPEDKLALLKARQLSGAVVAAVGDGINDAPLLAQADVSVALVAGSQLAQASADVVFTGDDLRVLARLPDWAAATRRIVRQNLAWAAVYNLAAVPLAAAGLLAPWMAAIGMSLSSLVVVGQRAAPESAARGRRGRTDGPRRAPGAGANSMSILFALIPLAIALLGLAVWAFFWAVRAGQFDDLDTPAVRILLDDDEPRDA